MSLLQKTCALLSQLDHELLVAFGHADALMADTYREARTLSALRRAIDSSIKSARELRAVIDAHAPRAAEIESDHA